MALAIRSGIPFSTWEAEGPRVIATALELLEQEAPAGEPAGPVMSG